MALRRWWPDWANALFLVQADTVVSWHRLGFRAYWRWRSRKRVGRPKVSAELRALIREMSQANPLWGAPRIHGELLKLVCLLKTLKCREFLAIAVPPPYRRHHDHGSFCSGFPPLISAS